MLRWSTSFYRSHLIYEYWFVWCDYLNACLTTPRIRVCGLALIFGLRFLYPEEGESSQVPPEWNGMTGYVSVYYLFGSVLDEILIVYMINIYSPSTHTAELLVFSALESANECTLVQYAKLACVVH